jgi:hypothetical protein
MARSVYQHRPGMLVERTTHFAEFLSSAAKVRNRRPVGLMADIVHNRIASGPNDAFEWTPLSCEANLAYYQKGETTALPGFCSGVTYSKSA